jgi:hypothetical protein
MVFEGLPLGFKNLISIFKLSAKRNHLTLNLIILLNSIHFLQF